MERVPASFHLGLYAFILATGIGIPLGILSAVKRGSIWDYIGRGIALFGQAIPQFWLAIVFIIIFAVTLGWFPAATRGDGWFDFKHAALPVVALAVSGLAGLATEAHSALCARHRALGRSHRHDRAANRAGDRCLHPGVDAAIAAVLHRKDRRRGDRSRGHRTSDRGDALRRRLAQQSPPRSG